MRAGKSSTNLKTAFFAPFLALFLKFYKGFPAGFYKGFPAGFVLGSAGKFLPVLPYLKKPADPGTKLVKSVFFAIFRD